MGSAAAAAGAARWIQRLSTARISTEALERGQSRVIDASLTLIRERAKLKVALSPSFISVSPPLPAATTIPLNSIFYLAYFIPLDPIRIARVPLTDEVEWMTSYKEKVFLFRVENQRQCQPRSNHLVSF
jgi:hypothetical protein